MREVVATVTANLEFVDGRVLTGFDLGCHGSEVHGVCYYCRVVGSDIVSHWFTKYTLWIPPIRTHAISTM